MRHGEAAGLLGIIGEIALRVQLRMVADDLDAVLVCTDRSVGTEAEEFAGDGALGRRIDLLGDLERQMRHIILDANGEVILELARKVLVHGVDHGRRELLGAEAVTAADDLDVTSACFNERIDHILIQRLAKGAGLLRAVENRDALAALGQRFDELLRSKRTIQADFQKAQLLSLCVQIVDGLFADVRAAAHDNDDVLCIRSANIIKEMIVTSRDLADLVHVMLDDPRDGVIVLVRGFAALEVDVGVLCCAALMRVLRVQCAGTEGGHGIAVEELIHIFIVDELDLLNLMGGTETVKEVEERNGAFDRGKMRNKRKVHDFLHGRGSQHGKTGLAAAHDVAVIAKDRQGMRRERTGADMEHAGQELAGDLIHIRDHQQQALRRRKGRRKRAGFQRAVDCARSTAFRLHLRDTDFLSEQIFAAVCCPIVRDLRHRRGRRDGIDRRYIGKCICNMRCSGVAIDGHGFCHCFSFLLIWN